MKFASQESYRDPDTGTVDPHLEQLFWGDLDTEGSPTASGDASESGDGANGAGGGNGDGSMGGGKLQLGTLLVHTVMQLLFLPGFTVDPIDAPPPASDGEWPWLSNSIMFRLPRLVGSPFSPSICFSAEEHE